MPGTHFIFYLFEHTQYIINSFFENYLLNADRGLCVARIKHDPSLAEEQKQEAGKPLNSKLSVLESLMFAIAVTREDMD